MDVEEAGCPLSVQGWRELAADGSKNVVVVDGGGPLRH